MEVSSQLNRATDRCGVLEEQLRKVIAGPITRSHTYSSVDDEDDNKSNDLRELVAKSKHKTREIQTYEQEVVSANERALTE